MPMSRCSWDRGDGLQRCDYAVMWCRDGKAAVALSRHCDIKRWSSNGIDLSALSPYHAYMKRTHSLCVCVCVCVCGVCMNVSYGVRWAGVQRNVCLTICVSVWDCLHDYNSVSVRECVCVLVWRDKHFLCVQLMPVGSSNITPTTTRWGRRERAQWRRESVPPLTSGPLADG